MPGMPTPSILSWRRRSFLSINNPDYENGVPAAMGETHEGGHQGYRRPFRRPPHGKGILPEILPARPGRGGELRGRLKVGSTGFPAGAVKDQRREAGANKLKNRGEPRVRPYSNSRRGVPDCRMIDWSVPIFSSAWSGTGTVIVPSTRIFCITIWLPRRRTSANPCRDRI